MIRSAQPVGTRGRGLLFPAARCILALAAAGVVACSDATETERANNAARTITADVSAGSVDSSCSVFPDTIAELLLARPDENDIPDTRLVLDAKCPRATVVVLAGPRIQRTYRVNVKAGHTLVARARGEFAPVALSFDYPALPKPDSSNFGRFVVDSINVNADREIAVRVMLIPAVKREVRESRVLLTVLVRPE